MKNFLITTGMVLIILASVLVSCRKEVIPSLTTAAITNITGISATGGGTVADEGSGKVVEKGICWSKENTPNISNNRSTNIVAGSSGTYTSEMLDLTPATTYYVRAYAVNGAGTGYGETVSFTTLGQAPTTLTQQATNVTTNSARLNGVVLANYISTTVTFEYGTTTGYGQTATPSQSPVSGDIITDVNVDLAELAEGTTYHFRIKAVNSRGTTYGNDNTFTTLGQAPVAVTLAACCLSATGGRLNGTVNANDLSTVVTFEYGLTSEYGSTVTAYQSPVTGNSPISVYSGVSGLTSVTSYHFRVKAVNSLGTTYGEDKVFITF